ncbi:hypothetical protein PanWU01x14_271440 [Parasponia andersonii]|uniref:Uncharacterized protein n=1 Tax=Parasponia andersonii TaxID=3476 RepID=A0A2P5B4Q3_PARAD|nr:hypothetical protein PanWU01x14_271440 [Parasponia andersonii]
MTKGIVRYVGSNTGECLEVELDLDGRCLECKTKVEEDCQKSEQLRFGNWLRASLAHRSRVSNRRDEPIIPRKDGVVKSNVPAFNGSPRDVGSTTGEHEAVGGWVFKATSSETAKARIANPK